MPEVANGSDRDIRPLLIGMIDAEASDLHIASGYKPTYRVNGKLTPISDRRLTAEMTEDWLRAVTPPQMRGSCAPSARRS